MLIYHSAFPKDAQGKSIHPPFSLKGSQHRVGILCLKKLRVYFPKTFRSIPNIVCQ